MNCKLFSFVPVRFISLSCSRLKVQFVGPFPKKKVVNIQQSPPYSVEKDAQKLATYVCGSNLFDESGEDVKLKPDSEYPDWLWSMRLPPPLEELDKNTIAYWERVTKIREKEIKYINSLQGNKSVHK